MTRGRSRTLVVVCRAQLLGALGLLLFACVTPKNQAGVQPSRPGIATGADLVPTAHDSGPIAAPLHARGKTRAITERERRAIEPLLRDAERVRELRFKRDVEIIVQDAAAIEAYVESQIEPVQVRDASALYGALGLLDPKLDLRALWLRLMGEQVVGYYDLDRGRLAIRDDVMRAFERGQAERRSDHGAVQAQLQEARVVLIHELVHALQDQHLGLAAIMDLERDTDAENALRALVEGDATLAMVSHALAQESVALSALTRDPARVRGLSEAVTAPMQGSELANAPKILRVSLLSAYVDGLAFTAALHGAGGFARVNRAYTALPISSEQVLHPERYARREPAPQIRLPQPQTLLGAESVLLLEDTLGELELRVYFAQAMSDAAAARAADGWAGDRVYVFEGPNGLLSAVWLTAWDNERHAIEAQRAAVSVRNALPPGARERHGVVRRSRSVLITREVTPAQLESVTARMEAWQGRPRPQLASARAPHRARHVGSAPKHSRIERPLSAW